MTNEGLRSELIKIIKNTELTQTTDFGHGGVELDEKCYGLLADSIIKLIAEIVPGERKWSEYTPQPDRTMNYAWNLCRKEMLEKIK